jgi:DMSO/TMAO reductase YedYZ heme-binding membrane subunit
VIVEPEKWTWYVARSGGIVAWLLLAAGLVVGLLLSSKLLGRRVSPAWLLSVHRYLGGIAVVFTVVHVAAVMLDDFVDFGWTDVLVPFASEWRPQAVAWGIVGMYLLVAIEVTSLAMRRLPKRLWRVVHWSSAGLFMTATVHGWQAGTDTGRAFMTATVTSIAVLGVLTFVRVVRSVRSRRPALGSISGRTWPGSGARSAPGAG